MREHTAAMQPPRALWVPFILGRPLGVPNDAAFQRRVLVAVLRLLEAKSGPVLEDYPEDAPRPPEQELEGFACPFTLRRPPAKSDLANELQREVAELVPWHETVIGQVFFKLREACQSSEDQALRHFGAKNVVPTAINPK